VIGNEDLHDLAAAYALDALDDTERKQFEDHLEDCPACSEEVDSLRSTASALAYAAEGPAPPAALRDRVLHQARAERPPEVVSIRRRRIALPVVAAVAAVAACAAIAFGVWASVLQTDLDSRSAQIGAVLANPDARHLAFDAQPGGLVVAPSGRAVLLASGIDSAPDGKTYEAWVIPEGGAPQPAGLFGGGKDAVLLLTRKVPQGTKVAVTVEPAGGVDQPTGPIVFGTRETV
jgi:anti-sigma-K factor RskA